MNPDFSLSDWMKNWGTLKSTTVSTYEWWELGAHASFDKLPASDRLKLMFKFQSVPVDFPMGLSELKDYAAHRQPAWEDGARAVTELRNTIIHPKRRETFYSASASVRRQARDLTLWYLSCVILRLFGYKGELPDVEARGFY